MIAIIDYGMGNLKSVTNAFKKLHADAVITRDRKVIEESKAIVLPGGRSVNMPQMVER